MDSARAHTNAIDRGVTMKPSRSLHGLIASSVLVACCSQSDPSGLTALTLTAPSKATTAQGVGSASSSDSAVGDVKAGPGALEIANLRMDRQTSSGESILRQYAFPGEEYAMGEGETIELWAEWNANQVSRNPRLLVDWGDGQSDFINCGSCLMKHSYPSAGRFIVTATLDDLSGTMVTRTFVLYTAVEPE